MFVDDIPQSALKIRNIPGRDNGSRITRSHEPSLRLSLSVNPLTGDANQERFTDGLTEDVIADLANFPELFVIASNTVFTYQGQVGKYFLSAV